MNRKIILYGFLLALLGLLLKFIEYRFLVRELTFEIYVGLIAIFFTVLGVWIGLKFTNKKRLKQNASETLPVNQENLDSLGLSNREYEVLQLIAKGHSNQEIAGQLFVSINTIKTHNANIFSKLDVKRRTQAVQKAKELKII